MGEYGKGLVEFEKDRSRFTSSVLGLTYFITTITLLLYLINIPFWTNVLQLSPALMFAMFIELYSIPAYEFWSTKQRFDYKYKKVVASSLGMAIGSVVIGVICVINTTYKLEARVFSDVLVKFLISGSFAVILIKEGKTLFNRKYWRYAFFFNLPLIPHFLSTMILNQSDRIMIKSMVGSTEAAIYSVSYTIGTMVFLVINAINNSFTPYTYQKIKNGTFEGIKKNSTILCAFVAIIIAISMAFAPEIVLIFAGSKYYEAIWVIPPVAASMYLIFVYSLFSNIEYYFKKTKQIAIASVICAIINLVLNYIFIPIFGYYAAGYTTLVCYVLYAMVHYLFCRNALLEQSIQSKRLIDLKSIISITAIVIIFMLIMIMTYQHIFIRYGVVCIIIVTCLLRRKYIISILKDIFGKAQN